MRRFLKVFFLLLLGVGFAGTAEALSFKELGVKAGLNLTRQQQLGFGGQVGGQFDTARLVLGGHLVLGPFMLEKMTLVPGADVVLESNARVFSANTEFWYFFHEGANSRGYGGGGIGVHFHRFDALANGQTFPNTTKITLNVPFGYQQKLSDNMGWFAQFKLVIADDERDSALQLNLGLAFGGKY
ncbi:MAG: hypothetical protein O7G87_19420 [bacterium]|nr:hypothetical protein [bacterium]